MFFVPLPKAIYACQGKVTKVCFSHFKGPHGVQFGVQKACGTLVPTEMGSAAHGDQKINKGEI